ncbi:YARHG domain-containing protein [Lachnospiraceae bacterium OF09-6]|nr:YARHG domain-containing protein [Lachnospiraceae bacterium OF09-6]
MGLYPAELVTIPITDQVDNLTKVNVIQRYLTEDIDTVDAYLDNPEAELMQYGETWLHSYQNENRENKNADNFAAYGEQSEALAETADSSEDYIIPDSDSRYITDEDLTGLSDYEILLARNEIYARHGRIFVNEDLNSYFRSKSWYQPAVSGEDFTEEYAASVFNEYERANIDTIVKYEQAHNINQM